MRYDGARLVVDDSRFLVEQGNSIVLLYAFRNWTNKPYVQCLRGPSGRNVLEDSPADHVHHHGVWWGHGDVNGVDFYLEVPRPGSRYGAIVHRSFEETVDDHPRFGFVDLLDWVDDAERTLISERRSLLLHLADPEFYTVDLESSYTALEGLHLGDTKESVLPSLRLAESLTGLSGGTITNSRGGVGEEQTMGVQAEWVDYSGTRFRVSGRGEATEGIAVLDHPSNPNHPPKFFCRAYGPLCPWQGNWFTGPSDLGAGETISARHRLVVHAGDVNEASIADRYSDWLQEGR
jgi:hypothetical protein